MKVVVYGGRKFTNRAFVFRELDTLARGWSSDLTVISGAAKGIDMFAGTWAMERGHPVLWFPVTVALRERYGGGAPFKRNQQMVDAKPDLGVQFPGENGTKDMRRRMDEAGIPVVEIFYEE